MTVIESAKSFVAVILSREGTGGLFKGAGLLFAALVGLHLVLASGAHFGLEPFQTLWRNGVLRLDVDHSLSEWVEYAALALAAVYLARSSWRTGEPIYYVLAWINLFILFDAAFRLHERMGGVLDPDAFWKGQLWFFGAVGVAALAIVVFGALRSSSTARGRALVLIAPLVGVFVSAVVFDAANSVLKLENYAAQTSGELETTAIVLQAGLAVLEDGGELFFLILNGIFCVRLYRTVAG